MERETGFEPATSTLARSHSTTELLPLSELIINERLGWGNGWAIWKRAGRDKEASQTRDFAFSQRTRE
jgi:hypothetical protein